jgi:hypothetical protein
MSWFADALLSSPVPPPNWLDPRHQGSGWVAPSGWFAASYRVPGEKVAAELETINSCTNPPVVQGWAWCLALAGVLTVVVGLATMHTTGAGDLGGILLVLAPLPVWFLAVVFFAFFSYDIELCDGSVWVRRWTDVWFGRHGSLVGSRQSIHAALSCGSHVQLSGDAAVITVSMAMWPSSSRENLEQRLDLWEIELEFPGRHHVHHPKHWNHGRHRLSHPIPASGRHHR